MGRTEELLNKLLDEHPPELILGALEEMAQINKEDSIIKLSEITNKTEAKNHQPN
ncbi:hypothetical protein MKY37_02010 [Psychrobacillus sp. FSL K6-2836]|uniref:hypothetical protein n=1 Tax=Psychrobacillus sp. FSL K6-2836 TaxID=2921548 RepID=UPI0030F9989F